jgi:hypothetical protein
MQERMLDDRFAEVKGRTERELDDAVRMDKASVDRSSGAVRLWQKREQIGFTRPQPLVHEVYFTDLPISQFASDLDPVLSFMKAEDVRNAIGEHNISFADAALAPTGTQRKRLRTTAGLKGSPRPTAAHILGTKRVGPSRGTHGVSRFGQTRPDSGHGRYCI